jgi:hypothetical protein
MTTAMSESRCPKCPRGRACPVCGRGAFELWGANVAKVSSLSEFVGLVKPQAPDSGARESGEYWYRGQTSHLWGLEPSFLRMARQEFMSKAHLFIEPGSMEKIKTMPCWWALMQHHGAPTRLLDWSASPYVAAYFATQQDGSDEDAAVWCFCHRRLAAAFAREYGKDLPELIRTEDEDPRVKRLHAALRSASVRASVVPLTFSYFSSARMAEQQGRFTMCLRVHQDHSIIATKIPLTHVRKIVIPHGAKPDFLAELRRMNITAAALFPGVDGLGRSIAELTSLGARHAAAARKA